MSSPCVQLAGVLGTEMQWSLVRAVFFIVGLQFSLRGSQEHTDLVVEQFTVSYRWFL